MRNVINDIEELHSRLLAMLLVVDKLCLDNGIRYFLAYGTELGAVREKGFIQWDDDVDLKVLREDYPKFKEVMQRELNGKIKFVEPADLAPFFFDFVPRIVDTEYYLNKDDEWGDAFDGLTNHPAMDVFIVDKISESRIKQKLKLFYLKVLYVFAMAKRPRVEMQKYSLTQKIIIGVVSFLARPLSIEDILDKYDIVSKSNEKKSTTMRFISNILFLDPFLYSEDIYEKIIRVEFENNYFPISAQYDSQLKTIYGDDYMIPRKPNEREMVHFKNN